MLPPEIDLIALLMDEPYRMPLAEIAALTDWQIDNLILAHQARKAREAEKARSGQSPAPSVEPQTPEEEDAALRTIAGLLGG